MRPIQTRYNGYFFRSRLEARWAVFFDACGLEWTYEAEGFSLDSGPYLPDFFVVTWDTFVEIKPNIEGNSLLPLLELARLTGKDAMLLCGQVWPLGHYSRFIGPKSEHSCDQEFEDTRETFHAHGAPYRDEFCECRRCKHIVLQTCAKWPGDDWVSYGQLLLGSHADPWACCEKEAIPMRLGHESAVIDAYRKARSARFEHGETPRP